MVLRWKESKSYQLHWIGNFRIWGHIIPILQDCPWIWMPARSSSQRIFLRPEKTRINCKIWSEILKTTTTPKMEEASCMLEAREGHAYNIYMCKVLASRWKNGMRAMWSKIRWFVACVKVQNVVDQTINVFLSWMTNTYFTNGLSTNDFITWGRGFQTSGSKRFWNSYFLLNI